MKKGDRDFNLDLFVRYVRAGRTPPKDLLIFIADGVEEFMREGKPWQIETGRPGLGARSKDHLQAVKCYAMDNAGISRKRASSIVSMSKSKYARYIEHGQACIESPYNQWSLIFAIEELIIDPLLTDEEKAPLREQLDQLKDKDEEAK